MAHNPNRRKIKNVSGKKLVKAVGIFAVCVYVACTIVDQRVTLAKRKAVCEEYEAKNAEERIKNQKLNAELEQAGTDEYLQKVAREKLGLVKANERVIIDITRQ